MYTVLFVYRGVSHECTAEKRATADLLVDAVKAFYSGDGIRVMLWNGATKLRDEAS